MSYFALAGFDVDKILGAIGPALNLAAAGQIEIAEAADIAAKIMAGMGLSKPRRWPLSKASATRWRRVTCRWRPRSCG